MICKICRKTFSITSNGCNRSECDIERNGNICLDCHNYMYHEKSKIHPISKLEVGLHDSMNEKEFDCSLRAEYELYLDNNDSGFLRMDRKNIE